MIQLIQLNFYIMVFELIFCGGMKNKIKNWLVIGIAKHWEIAFSQPVPIWGLKPSYKADFQFMDAGDILWFYATSPVTGVIGMGLVKDKYIDDINLVWPDEWKRKEVIWPLRFRIQVLKVLPLSNWRKNKIKINDFGLFWQMGFQLLKDEHVKQLFNLAKTIFGVEEEKDFFTGATVTPQSLVLGEKPATYSPAVEEKESTITHRELQNRIAEIGKLQFYYTELEYPLELYGEGKNLDVVWKREIDGVPSFVFEIELSGMIEKAIDRLKFAFRKWNSRPRIIVPERFEKKIHNLIAVSEREFSRNIKIYQPLQITELLSRKRELKTAEQNLEMY
jgi:hypothetical protein